MPSLVVASLVYALFFLSGAAALVYQVVWVRAFTLVFGGSHLAVTAVLSIFMGGLALGGYVIGRRVDRAARPLRLYGGLEIGLAVAAVGSTALVAAYPSLYAAAASGRDGSPVVLTVIRLAFATAALIVPTTLMGGTLPALARFVSRQPDELRSRLSFLYGINTLGAVFGALAAGFLLLPRTTVRATLAAAILASLVTGILAFLVDRRAGGAAPHDGAIPTEPSRDGAIGRPDPADSRVATLVLWGIGLSGFCALGYEVLWTRILTLAIGASVYGFTIILVAFLAGIALGSGAHGVLATLLPGNRHVRRATAWFGLTQLAIGASALVVTAYLRDVPVAALRLQAWFPGDGAGGFRARVWTGFVLACVYVIVPATFMGAAFPLAGEALARHRRAVGRAVGDVLSVNTIGAVLGAALSGLVLVRVFGLERSLQLLCVVNLAAGAMVLAGLARSRWPSIATGAVCAGTLLFLAVDPAAVRFWDTRYFAVFRSNQPEAFRTPEMVREAVENTDILYYAEGAEAIVSVIQVKGGERAFVTNGRVEASSHPQARQCQYTLGHLPMLLHRDPKQVLVVGLGSGMTAGATAVHPGVERVTLVEIEPAVLGVARRFADYNHAVVEQPNVQVIVNDGRNFLLTTDRTFDVITADPIHPWFRGAGYLYSSEYFRLAASHLRPGGIIAQWLPIYELTPRDLQSIVRTFQLHFAYTMLWLTHYDAEIVGSNQPMAIDEAALARRLTAPVVGRDLDSVMMGTPDDLLAYFVMGTEGMRRFAEPGVVNTDDNLYLEFSAPFSMASPAVMAENVIAITKHREALWPYFAPSQDPVVLERRRAWSERQLAAASVGDSALALFLGRQSSDPGFARRLERLGTEHVWYAPGRFLESEYRTALSLEPRPLEQWSFSVVSPDGRSIDVDLAAVLVPVSPTRAAVMFVDGSAREVYGQVYVDGDGSQARQLASTVMAEARAAYDREALVAVGRGRQLPPAQATLHRIKDVIHAKVQGVRQAS